MRRPLNLAVNHSTCNGYSLQQLHSKMKLRRPSLNFIIFFVFSLFAVQSIVIVYQAHNSIQPSFHLFKTNVTLYSPLTLTQHKKILIINRHQGAQMGFQKTGGPLGEQILFRSLKNVLGLIKNIEIVEAYEVDDIKSKMRDDSFHFVYADQYNIDFLRASLIYSKKKV